eukprot:SAG25_NODE_7106_length_504_cov_1.123457_1_plen_49_part_10
MRPSFLLLTCVLPQHVHMPNVYDRGAWQNFAEVVWPRSQRLDAVSVVSS